MSTPGEKSVFNYAYSGNLDLVKKWCSENSDRCTLIHTLKNEERNSCTVLYTAARFGHTDIVRWILSECGNMSVNVQQATGSTPLHGAAYYHFYPICLLLIENGADVTIRNSIDVGGHTYHYSALEELGCDEVSCGESQILYFIVKLLSTAELCPAPGRVYNILSLFLKIVNQPETFKGNTIPVLAEWQPQHVKKYLQHHYFHPKIINNFSVKNIDGKKLSEISKQELMDLSLTADDANKVLDEVEIFKNGIPKILEESFNSLTDRDIMALSLDQLGFILPFLVSYYTSIYAINNNFESHHNKSWMALSNQIKKHVPLAYRYYFYLHQPQFILPDPWNSLSPLPNPSNIRTVTSDIIIPKAFINAVKFYTSVEQHWEQIVSKKVNVSDFIVGNFSDVVFGSTNEISKITLKIIGMKKSYIGLQYSSGEAGKDDNEKLFFVARVDSFFRLCIATLHHFANLIWEECTNELSTTPKNTNTNLGTTTSTISGTTSTNSGTTSTTASTTTRTISGTTSTISGTTSTTASTTTSTIANTTLKNDGTTSTTANPNMSAPFPNPISTNSTNTTDFVLFPFLENFNTTFISAKMVVSEALSGVQFREFNWATWRAFTPAQRLSGLQSLAGIVLSSRLFGIAYRPTSIFVRENIFVPIYFNYMWNDVKIEGPDDELEQDGWHLVGSDGTPLPGVYWEFNADEWRQLFNIVLSGFCALFSQRKILVSVFEVLFSDKIRMYFSRGRAWINGALMSYPSVQVAAEIFRNTCEGYFAKGKFWDLLNLCVIPTYGQHRIEPALPPYLVQHSQIISLVSTLQLHKHVRENSHTLNTEPQLQNKRQMTGIPEPENFAKLFCAKFTFLKNSYKLNDSKIVCASTTKIPSSIKVDLIFDLISFKHILIDGENLLKYFSLFLIFTHKFFEFSSPIDPSHWLLDNVLKRFVDQGARLHILSFIRMWVVHCFQDFTETNSQDNFLLEKLFEFFANSYVQCDDKQVVERIQSLLMFIDKHVQESYRLANPHIKGTPQQQQPQTRQRHPQRHSLKQSFVQNLIESAVQSMVQSPKKLQFSWEFTQPLTLANTLHFMDLQIWRKIDFWDIIDKKTIQPLIEHNNKISNWVIAGVTGGKHIRSSVERVVKLLECVKILIAMNNLSSPIVILTALKDKSIASLSLLWKLLPKHSKEILQKFIPLTNPTDNFRNLSVHSRRIQLKNSMFCVPYIQQYTSFFTEKFSAKEIKHNIFSKDELNLHNFCVVGRVIESVAKFQVLIRKMDIPSLEIDDFLNIPIDEAELNKSKAFLSSNIDQLCSACSSGDYELVHLMLDCLNCTVSNSENLTISMILKIITSYNSNNFVLNAHDLNGKNSDGITAITCAVLNNHPNIVELLLVHELSRSVIDTNVTDKKFRGLVQSAMEEGFQSVLSILLSSEKVPKPNIGPDKLSEISEEFPQILEIWNKFISGKETTATNWDLLQKGTEKIELEDSEFPKGLHVQLSLLNTIIHINDALLSTSSSLLGEKVPESHVSSTVESEIWDILTKFARQEISFVKDFLFLFWNVIHVANQYLQYSERHLDPLINECTELMKTWNKCNIVFTHFAAHISDKFRDFGKNLTAIFGKKAVTSEEIQEKILKFLEFFSQYTESHISHTQGWYKRYIFAVFPKGADLDSIIANGTPLQSCDIEIVLNKCFPNLVNRLKKEIGMDLASLLLSPLKRVIQQNLTFTELNKKITEISSAGKILPILDNTINFIEDMCDSIYNLCTVVTAEKLKARDQFRSLISDNDAKICYSPIRTFVSIFKLIDDENNNEVCWAMLFTDIIIILKHQQGKYCIEAEHKLAKLSCEVVKVPERNSTAIKIMETSKAGGGNLYFAETEEQCNEYFTLIMKTKQIPTKQSSNPIVDKLIMALSAHSGGLSALKIWAGNPISKDLNSPISANNNTPLCIASLCGNTHAIEWLLNNGALPNVKGRDGMTPLHYAVENRLGPACKALLQGGADVTVLNDFHETPLDLATDVPLIHNILLPFCKNLSENLENFQQPIEGIDPFVAVENHDTAALEQWSLGNDVNQHTNKSNDTLLFHAAMHKHTNIIIKLLQWGAWINAKHVDSGNSALHIAACFGHEEPCTVLIKFGADINIKNKFGQTPLDITDFSSHIHTAIFLEKCSPVHDQEFLEELKASYLRKNALPRQRGYRSQEHSRTIPTRGQAPFMSSRVAFLAATDQARLSHDQSAVMFQTAPAQLQKSPQSETEKLFEECKTGKISELENLSSESVNHLTDSNHNPLLYVAASYGHVNAVSKLLEKGAWKDRKQNNGSTALHAACYRSHIDVVKLLLEKGANPNIQNNYNELPIDNTKDELIIDVLKQYMPQFKKIVENNKKTRIAKAKWLVDGKDTFTAIIKAIENAKHHIYIADWWLSATLYVKRSTNFKDRERLDFILSKKATEGVKIFILLWAETRIVSNNYSEFNKRYLEGLSANISVVCHPPMTPVKWSHHQKFVVVDDLVAFVGGIDLTIGRYDWHQHLVVDYEENHFWGIDVYRQGLQPQYIEDPNKRVTPEPTWRMPWHDIHMAIKGEAALDVAHNFVERWNHHTISMDKVRYPVLSINFNKLPDPYPENELFNEVVCKVVRSMTTWSGSTKIDTSYYEAYKEALLSARHFVYIENQFFISKNCVGVENSLSNLIVDQISAAIIDKRLFRVIIVTPQPEDLNYNHFAVVYFQYQTICRGGKSMIETLKDRHPGIDISQYLLFLQLRNYGWYKSKSVTEQVYIHSKLLIVDDKKCIIGSANINDRSLVGRRDSELGVFILDGSGPDERIQIKMGGNPWTANKFAHNLRKKLFLEHMGYLDNPKKNTPDDVNDPISDEFYNKKLIPLARKNTDIYEYVFPKVPRDTHLTWAMYTAAQTSVFGIPEQEAKLKDIEGFFTLYPMNFLIAEPRPTFNLVPERVFQ